MDIESCCAFYNTREKKDMQKKPRFIKPKFLLQCGQKFTYNISHCARLYPRINRFIMITNFFLFHDDLRDWRVFENTFMLHKNFDGNCSKMNYFGIIEFCKTLDLKKKKFLKLINLNWKVLIKYLNSNEVKHNLVKNYIILEMFKKFSHSNKNVWKPLDSMETCKNRLIQIKICKTR